MSNAEWDAVAAELETFVAEREWDQFHDPKNLSMLIASEAGELLALFRWVENRAADTFAAAPENRDDVYDELADVTIGALLLARRLRISLPDLVARKIARNREKYPVATSRGRAERDPS
jgi:NTP pyrophosphatase (non-canonical NTP hydrolase)